MEVVEQVPLRFGLALTHKLNVNEKTLEIIVRFIITPHNFEY